MLAFGGVVHHLIGFFFRLERGDSPIWEDMKKLHFFCSGNQSKSMPLGACEKAGEWRSALNILWEMKGRKLSADAQRMPANFFVGGEFFEYLKRDGCEMEGKHDMKTPTISKCRKMNSQTSTPESSVSQGGPRIQLPAVLQSVLVKKLRSGRLLYSYWAFLKKCDLI